MGVHRDAEFNERHVPGFLRGLPPKAVADGLPVRAQLRVVPAARGRAHARCSPSTAARAASSCRCIANTVASFALGDYEWLLPLEADELDRPRRPHARPARHRRPPPRARGGAVLHRAAHRPRRARGGALVSEPVADRRVDADRSRRREAGGIRPAHVEAPAAYDAHPARRLRRARGPGRRDPVPAQRHARSRHPRRAARGGRAPLPALRRRQPDQRAEPRAQGRPRGRARRARHRPAGALGQPQLGPVPRATPCSEAAERRLHRRCSRSPRARTARTRAAASTARTSRRALDETGLAGRCTIDKVRQFFDHPGFVHAVHRGRARRRRASWSPTASQPTASEVLFSTHSIPTTDAAALRSARPRLRRGRRLRRAAPRGRRGRDAT